MFFIIKNTCNLQLFFAFKISNAFFMIDNIISFNNLIARISECSKRMTSVRHEMRLKEESGKETEHQRRELFNLNNEINLLRSRLQCFQRKQHTYSNLR